jgi:APA family basic amino acid/polyamine antiporter
MRRGRAFRNPANALGAALSHANPTILDAPVAEVQAARDRGLVRDIGTTAMAANVVNGVIGAGIFTLPAAVALSAGAAAPIAYIITAVVMAGVVICFAEAGSRVPTSGGAYGTVEAAFGPATGFVAGMLLLVSDVLASGGIAAGLVDMDGAAGPAAAAAPVRAALLAILYLLVAGLNLIGVKQTVRAIAAATAAKIVPLLLFLVLGVASISLPAPHGSPMPPVTLAGFGQGLILTLFAFSGMETAVCNSGEVRDPARALPRAIMSAMLFILALYVGVQLTAQHLLGAALPHAAAPLADGAARFGPLPRAIMLTGAMISMVVWLCSDVLGTSRLLFAFGRDGELPAWFGTVTPRTRVPANAIASYVTIAFLLAVTGTFLSLVVLSALAVVGIYSLVCAAAFVLRKRNVAVAGPPLNFAALPAAAALGLLGMLGMLLAARWRDVAGLAGMIVASWLLYLAMRARRR